MGLRAGWVVRIALWSGTGAPTYIDAHEGQITGLVGFAGGLASVGAALRLRLWSSAGAPAGQTQLSAPASGLASGGEALFLASPDGTLRRIVPDTAPDTAPVEAALSNRPLLAVAAGAGMVAAAGTTGEVWLLDPVMLETRAGPTLHGIFGRRIGTAPR